MTLVMVAVGCGDDTIHAATQGGTQGTADGTTHGVPSEESGGDTTSAGTDASASSEGDATNGDTTEGDTDEPGMQGHAESQTVASGHRISSRRFIMVYTLGQPSALNGTHVSPNYTIQGGLVGANASAP